MWQNYGHEDLGLLSSWGAGGLWGPLKAAPGSFSSGSGGTSTLASLRLWGAGRAGMAWARQAAPGGPPVPALPQGSQAPNVAMSSLPAVAPSGSQPRPRSPISA